MVYGDHFLREGDEDVISQNTDPGSDSDDGRKCCLYETVSYLKSVCVSCCLFSVDFRDFLHVRPGDIP